jgi:hypothetical protein
MKIFIEVANLVMLRVLPNSAAPRGNPAARKRTPAVTMKFPSVARDIPANERRYLSDDGHFQTLDDVLRFILVCIMLGVKFPHWEESMKSYMKSPKRLLDAHMRKSKNPGVLSIQVFFMFGPVSSSTIIDFFKTKVQELFKADPSIKFGFKFNPTDLWFVLEPKFHSLFEVIAGKMLNPESAQTFNSDQMMEIITKNQEPSIKALPGIREETIDEIQSDNLATARILEAQAKDHQGNLTELFGLLPPSRTPAKIFAQNAVLNPQREPFVPAQTTRLLNAPVHSVHEQSVPAQVLESLPQSHRLMRRLDDTSVQVVHERLVSLPVPTVSDATELVSAVVNELLEEAIANVIVKSAEAIGAGNQAALSRIFGEESDANALRKEVASQASIDESAAFTDASAALEVVGLVYAAAAADESVFQDPPNLNPLARSVEPVIQPSSPVKIFDVPVSPTDYFHPASSETSSLKNVTPGDAESAALFVAINSPIPPLPGQTEVYPQNHANEAGGPLSVIPEEEEEDDADQSGKSSPLPPNGEGRAHFTTSAQSPPEGVEDRALGAQPKSHLSNLGSTPSSGQNGTFLTHDFPDLLASLAISSKSSFTLPTKPIVPSPELTDTGVGGAHSSDIPSKSALFHVGVRWNPHANQPSFSPQGNGGPPVQVLAKSGKPPSGDSDGADHLETPSSSTLWSSCIPGRKTSSASQPGNSSSSWRKIFHRQSNRVNPDPGQTNDTRLPVALSSDKNPSGSAATPALSPQMCPSGHEKGVSNLVAHSPDKISSGSAAAPALSPQMCPSGHEKGVIERNGVRSQFEDLAFLLLMMKYTTAQPSLPPLWTHPCLPRVPTNLALQSSVA